jgi:hypothetical protein
MPCGAGATQKRDAMQRIGSPDRPGGCCLVDGTAEGLGALTIYDASDEAAMRIHVTDAGCRGAGGVQRLWRRREPAFGQTEWTAVASPC